MAGPARYHSFLDSLKNSLEKSRTLLIRGMSSGSGVKEEAMEEFVDRKCWSRFW